MATEPICSTTVYYCVGCDEQDSCAADYPTTPNCDDGTGECVECTEDVDCQDADGGAPLDSPVGVCTPDRVCTCWVNGAADWTCATEANCDAAGPDFYCARDFNGVHYVCLRTCGTAAEPDAGLACEMRETAESGDQLVWVPMTTCYAYFQFGADCSLDTGLCSVDGTGGISDAACPDGLCTYNCNDGSDNQDPWCPDAVSCGDSFPYNGLCVPE